MNSVLSGDFVILIVRRRRLRTRRIFPARKILRDTQDDSLLGNT